MINVKVCPQCHDNDKRWEQVPGARKRIRWRKIPGSFPAVVELLQSQNPELPCTHLCNTCHGFLLKHKTLQGRSTTPRDFTDPPRAKTRPRDSSDFSDGTLMMGMGTDNNPQLMTRPRKAGVVALRVSQELQLQAHKSAISHGVKAVATAPAPPFRPSLPMMGGMVGSTLPTPVASMTSVPSASTVLGHCVSVGGGGGFKPIGSIFKVPSLFPVGGPIPNPPTYMPGSIPVVTPSSSDCGALQFSLPMLSRLPLPVCGVLRSYRSSLATAAIGAARTVVPRSVANSAAPMYPASSHTPHMAVAPTPLPSANSHRSTPFTAASPKPMTMPVIPQA